MEQYLQSGDVITDVFQEQKAMMPSGGQQKIAPESWADIWQSILDTPLEDQALVYINIPFCINRCVFCGFYKNKWQETAGPVYVDRLIAELAYEAQNRPHHGGKIAAVYLGGGTPTALSAKDLYRLLGAIRTYLPLSDDCEITVEGRMTHFDEEKVETCILAGANRFSIGVQTFSTHIRQRLGRKHSGEDAAQYMANLAKHKEAVVVLDLIYGLPGQSHEIWENDIETALSLGLDGLDVYSFKCFPSLPINRMIEKKAFPPLPTVEVQATQYAYAVRKMEDCGWKQISNSHFASETLLERNIYNTQIKFGTPFLSFGSGGGGCRAGYSYSGCSDLDEYLKTPLDQKPLGSLSKVAPTRSFTERIRGHIELGRIPYQYLPEKNENVARLLQLWEEKRLLNQQENYAQLTIPGRFWGNALSRSLIDTLSFTA